MAMNPSSTAMRKPCQYTQRVQASVVPGIEMSSGPQTWHPDDSMYWSRIAGLSPVAAPSAPAAAIRGSRPIRGPSDIMGTTAPGWSRSTPRYPPSSVSTPDRVPQRETTRDFRNRLSGQQGRPMELVPGCMVHRDRIQTQALLFRDAGLLLGRSVPAHRQHQPARGWVLARETQQKVALSATTACTTGSAPERRARHPLICRARTETRHRP